MSENRKQKGQKPKSNRKDIPDGMPKGMLQLGVAEVMGLSKEVVEVLASRIFETDAARAFGIQVENHTLNEGSKRLTTPHRVKTSAREGFNPALATEDQLLLAEKIYQYTNDYVPIYEFFGDLMAVEHEEAVVDRIYGFILNHKEVLSGICFTKQSVLKVLCSFTKVIDPGDKNAVCRLRYHLKRKMGI